MEALYDAGQGRSKTTTPASEFEEVMIQYSKKSLLQILALALQLEFTVTLYVESPSLTCTSA